MSEIKEISQAWEYKGSAFNTKEKAYDAMIIDKLMVLFNQRPYSPIYNGCFVADQIIKHKDQIRLILAGL